jgi:hypothetical protein
MQYSEVYIAVQHEVPEELPGPVVEGIASMTTTSTQTPTTGQRVNSLVAEVFQAATIALVGVLGILTVAATI